MWLWGGFPGLRNGHDKVSLFLSTYFRNECRCGDAEVEDREDDIRGAGDGLQSLPDATHASHATFSQLPRKSQRSRTSCVFLRRLRLRFMSTFCSALRLEWTHPLHIRGRPLSAPNGFPPPHGNHQKLLSCRRAEVIDDLTWITTTTCERET
jgi:hypothetical protein